MPEKNDTSLPELPEWGKNPKPERRKTHDELYKELAELTGEVEDASANPPAQNGNSSRPLLWKKPANKEEIMDLNEKIVVPDDIANEEVSVKAAEDDFEIDESPEELTSGSREAVAETVQTPQEVIEESTEDEVKKVETTDKLATVKPAVAGEGMKPIQPEKEILEPSELNNILKQEAWILGGIVSEQRLLEDGSILAKILIRKELQHWANESVKENSENMVDYTEDDKKYFILALMTETGEFLQFDNNAYADKVGPFNIDECYHEKNLETLQPWWEKKPKKQA